MATARESFSRLVGGKGKRSNPIERKHSELQLDGKKSEAHTGQDKYLGSKSSPTERKSSLLPGHVRRAERGA